MLCHKCPHVGKLEGLAWEQTPCAKCVLKQGASHTREYSETILDKEKEDLDVCQPYEGMTGTADDPMIPLSVLGKAMACWISLTLPAREVFSLRMNDRSLGRIAYILGISRIAVFYILKRAIKDNPVMASLSSGSQEHRKGRKRKIIRREPGL